MLDCQREKFYLPEEQAYLNCAYMSPLLKTVDAIGKTAIEGKRLPYLVTGDDFFTPMENLKQCFSKLINNNDADRIAIMPSTSYGISTVTNNIHLQKGDNIIVVDEQFPSNVYPWHVAAAASNAKVITVKAPDGTQRGKIWNERILEAINTNTKVVAIGHTHWADGTKFDLVAIRKRTREVGALLIIDGTQSVGALPFDVAEIQPDALICAGYKWLMGPYSIGVAYFGEYFDGGKPIEENWINRKNSESFADLVNYQNQYKEKAARYSVGEQSNFILVPMLRVAIDQLNEWQPKNIQEYCGSIITDGLNELSNLGYSVEDAAYRGNHLFGIRLPEHINQEKLTAKFAEKNVYVSLRGSAIRVSPHVYDTVGDFEKLVGCFREV